MIILGKTELNEWVGELARAVQTQGKIGTLHVIGQLLGGERLLVCDEAVAEDIEGMIFGVATITPQWFGRPEIVAIYVLPQFRNQSHEAKLLEGAVRRCQERGFEKVHFHTMCASDKRAVAALPQELRGILEVTEDPNDILDFFFQMEA